MTTPYACTFPIRFNDIDAAGIVYFPRLLHFCHCALEDFVTDRSARSYRRYVTDGLVFPVIKIEGGFFRRVHYLDRLQVLVQCEEIRTHAFRMRYDLAVIPGEGGGVPQDSARIVIAQAVTRVQDFTLEEVPADLRTALESVALAAPEPPSGGSLDTRRGRN
ncbi:MAG: acyl-CoA thioesterase [bacterium]